METGCPFKSKPRWTRRKEARPQELLAAALDLFVDRGFAATRLDDGAAQAGVSKGTLYLYFANKEDLFKAVVREHVLPAIGESEALLAGFEGSSTELLKAILSGWWERFGMTKLSGITKLMMAESGNFPEVARFYHDEVIQRWNAVITRAVERGMASGEFRAMDVEYTVQVVIAPILMLMLWQHSFTACRPTPVDAARFLASYAEVILNGLRAAPPAEKP